MVRKLTQAEMGYDPEAPDKDRAEFVTVAIAKLAFKICNAVEAGSEPDLDSVAIGAACIELGAIWGFDPMAYDLDEECSEPPDRDHPGRVGGA